MRNSIEQTRSTEVRHEARILEGWLSSFFLVFTSMSDKNVILNINVDDLDSSLYVLEYESSEDEVLFRQSSDNSKG